MPVLVHVEYLIIGLDQPSLQTKYSGREQAGLDLMFRLRSELGAIVLSPCTSGADESSQDGLGLTSDRWPN